MSVFVHPPRSCGIRFAIRQPNLVLVHVRGELDLATAPDLESRLVTTVVAQRRGVLVVDLARLDFLGVAGINALLKVRCQAERRNVEFRLVAATRTVLLPLELLDLGRAFSLHPTVDTAMPR
ncbi:STAS domain-containing protein [Allokutzneria albata]|uniref:Anti-sigma factor antagonist n=1 Tax=Allokutzneria albata TaxID=211114 RepID=A0A1G9T399_ALLAB|nr:STAS domain-containing protein [Allokutzneria albata]SDM42193.1 anti-anti-sigma factor [Allokutzneria albata]